MAEAPKLNAKKSSGHTATQRSKSLQGGVPDDGTTQLLRGGSLITAIGAIAIALLMTALGGVGVEGAHNNSGWLALITGAMCLPFGLMLTVLGLAKWLRNRSLSRNKRTQLPD